MRRKPGAVAAAAMAALTVTACSASQATANTRTVGNAAAHGTPTTTTIKDCRVGAWAENFTDAGRLTWQVSLPAAPGLGSAQQAQPLVIGGVTVFADGNELYALRLGDGHQLWRKVFGTVKADLGPVLSIVAWHGSVVALAGAKLVALDAVTGAVRWTTTLGDSYSHTLTVTSDGIAVFRIGRQGSALAAVDLSTGKGLWSRGSLKAHRLAVSGRIVVVASQASGQSPVKLTGIQARSGTVLWSRTFPGWVEIMSAPGGRVLVYLPASLPMPGKSATAYPVIALSAGTGKTLWQLKTHGQPREIWATPAGVVVVTQFFGKPFSPLTKIPPPRLNLTDLNTGKLRWSDAISSGQTTYPAVTPVVTATDVVFAVTTAGGGTVTDYSARSGAVEWKAAIGGISTYGHYLARPAGPNVLVIAPTGASSQLLALDAATGVTKATHRLPFTSTVGVPLTVVGGSALVEPQTASCAPPAHPLPGQPRPLESPA